MAARWSWGRSSSSSAWYFESVRLLFPAQLAAFERHPTLMAASFSTFVAGTVLMWPGIVALALLISTKRPGLALCGGTLAIFGLFARTFHAGVDHLAFQLVRVQDLERATQAVANSYAAFHLFRVVSFAIIPGWILLAVGAYRSGTLGPVRAAALSLMAALMSGVLKGSTPVSVVATTGLCVALVPLGIKVLRGYTGLSGRDATSVSTGAPEA